MTPTDKGRFCASCHKTVIDFTVMTDTEVLNTFRKMNNNLCGHFFEDQLNREMIHPRPSRWWQPLLQKVAAGFLLFQSVVVNAQTPIKKKAATTQESVDKKHDANYIHGHVYHYNTTIPVANVCVRISGTDITATTDAKGYFNLPIAAVSDNPLTLVAEIKPATDTFFVEQRVVSTAETQGGKAINLYGYFEKKLSGLTLRSYSMGMPLMTTPTPDVKEILPYPVSDSFLERIMTRFKKRKK